MKNIIDFPGYFITQKGEVLSDRSGYVKPLSIRINGYGYYIVIMYKDKKRHEKKVHRLVAAAFIDNPNNKPDINHIDGNKLNNDVSNLEWCTKAENNRHAASMALQRGYFKPGKRNINSTLDESIVLKIRQEYSSGSTTIRSISKKHSISEKQASDVIRGRTWKHVGGETRKYKSGLDCQNSSIKTIDEVIKIVKMYELGLKKSEIARKLGIGSNVIAKQIRKYYEGKYSGQI